MSSPVDALRVSIYGLWLQTRNNFGRDHIQQQLHGMIADWLEGVKRANVLPDSETTRVRGQLAATDEVRIRLSHRIVELEGEVMRLKSGDYSPELREKDEQIRTLADLLENLSDGDFARTFPAMTIEQVKARLQLLDEIESKLLAAATPPVSTT